MNTELKVLHLTLSKKPFEVMHTGEKPLEYRENKPWIVSRLIDKKTGKPKQYDVVKFTNGYGKNAPYFICEYEGFFQSMIECNVQYSNGFSHLVEKGMIVISLGKIIFKKI